MHWRYCSLSLSHRYGAYNNNPGRIEASFYVQSLQWRHNERNSVSNHQRSISIVCLTVCSAANRRQLQRSASLAFVRGIQQWLVNSPHKRPVAQNMFPFDDAIMVVCLRLSHEKLSTSHNFLWDIISHHQLTHWGQNKMPNKMTFSNAFSWMKNIWIPINI